MIVKELLLGLGVDVDSQAFRAADSAMTGLYRRGQALAAAFGLYKIASGFVGIVDGAITAGAAADDLAQKLGVNVEALQELQFAAGMSGVGAEQFGMGMSFLTRTLAEAAQGNEAAAKTFSQFGIAVRGSDGHVRQADAVLGDIADRMARAATDTERMGIATAFFGARAGQMAVMLKGGSAGVEELRKQARELGGVMSEDMIKKTAEADDQLFALGFAFQGVKNAIAVEVLPALLAFARAALAAIQRAGGAMRLLSEYVDRAREVWEDARGWILGVAGAVAFLKVSFWLFSAALWNVNGAFVATGIAGAAAGAQVAAAWLLAKLEVLSLYAIVGSIALAFVFVGLVIAAVVEEIIAMFTDTEGLFETLAGKWDKLADALWEDVDFSQHPLMSFLKAILSFITRIISGWDMLFGAVFKGIDLFDEFLSGLNFKVDANGNSLVDEQGNLRSLAGNGAVPVTPSPAARAAGATSNAVTNAPSVVVNVDASGQSLDEEALSGMIGTQIDQSLERHMQHAERALTPALAGG